MSYDIRAVHENGETIYFDEPHSLAGGTYALDGSYEAWLNITYNYASFYYKYIDGGLNSFDGQQITETIGTMLDISSELKGEPSEDYWEATEGNARVAMLDLLELGCKAIAVDIKAEWRVR